MDLGKDAEPIALARGNAIETAVAKLVEEGKIPRPFARAARLHLADLCQTAGDLDSKIPLMLQRMAAIPGTHGDLESKGIYFPEQNDEAAKMSIIHGLDEGEEVLTASSEKRFRVALSFPGERRDFVGAVADLLAAIVQRERVLYDKYHEPEFARPNLDTYLQHLYHDESDLIVVFLCADYEEKEWCGLESRPLRNLIKQRKDSAIMFFRFDGTDVSGIFGIDGYISVDKQPPNKIARLILDRLAQSS